MQLKLSSCFFKQEMQTLERSNTALAKEISQLEKELERYVTALKEHEPHCTLSCWSGTSIPNTSTSDLPQPFSPNPGGEPNFPVNDPTIPDSSLDELLCRTDWMSWDSDLPLSSF